MRVLSRHWRSQYVGCGARPPCGGGGPYCSYGGGAKPPCAVWRRSRSVGDGDGAAATSWPLDLTLCACSNGCGTHGWLGARCMSEVLRERCPGPAICACCCCGTPP